MILNKSRISTLDQVELSTDSIKKFFNETRAVIQDMHNSGASSREIVRVRTEAMDSFLRALFNRTRELLSHDEYVPSSLVAVGGYGRQELNPASDMDIIFLHDDVKVESRGLIPRMLYPLWDSGVDISYSIRDASECVQLSMQNDAVLTSLLDARFVEGERAIYDRFEKTMKLSYIQNLESILNRLYRAVEIRRAKSQKPYHFLEPNVKEGEGCLRDFHTIRWLLFLKFGTHDLHDLVRLRIIPKGAYLTLMRAVDFLWRVRNELHIFYKRKQDEMNFEDQKRLAEMFGFRDTDSELGVEKFMKMFYFHTGQIRDTLEEVLDRTFSYHLERETFILSSPIHVEPPFVFDGYSITVDRKPSLKSVKNILRIFPVISKTGLEMDRDLKLHIKRYKNLLNRHSLSRHENSQLFWSIFEGSYAYKAILSMYKSGIIFRLFPEFKRIYFKVQYDIYHVYTVDNHSLLVLNELDRLRRGEYQQEHPLLTHLIKEVSDLPLLYFTALFHDVGKGYGKGHSRRGAKVIEKILRRMRADDERIRKASFLVLNHLNMSQMAQRRDLNDLKQVIDFAKQVEDREKLKLLYLLTFADLKSVGPDVWNYWKAALLQELYIKAEEVLEKGEFSYHQIGERVAGIQDMIRNRLLKMFSREETDNIIETFPLHYFMTNTPEEIVQHVEIMRKLNGEKFVIQKDDFEEKKFSRILFTSMDSPGLFSRITGVLSSNGINILSARINTLRNGRVLDVYYVNDIMGEAVSDPVRWERTLKDFNEVMEGRVRIEQLVSSRLKPSILKKKVAAKLPTRVLIDNDASDIYTVIEVFTNDRPGVLYTITSTLASLSLNICTAKISTKVDQVADVFYVSDLQGRKILDRRELAIIKKSLLSALGG